MAGRLRIVAINETLTWGMAMADVGMPRRRRELLVFLFLTVVLAPMLAVAIVGGYGFMVWMYQLFAGPPGS
jgi:periplasmic nitrate reductase NapE